jgi:hypothetical protein
MSIDDKHGATDMVTVPSPAESDADEFDNWLEVLSNLVYNSADLSRHRDDYPAQGFEETFVAEESLPVIPKLHETTLVL